MPRHTPLYDWTTRVATHFPDLPKATAETLAAWSYGLVLTHACGLTAVALTLAAVLAQAVNTVRQRSTRFEKSRAAGMTPSPHWRCMLHCASTPYQRALSRVDGIFLPVSIRGCGERGGR